jgi:hypothetical protein
MGQPALEKEKQVSKNYFVISREDTDLNILSTFIFDNILSADLSLAVENPIHYADDRCEQSFLFN